MLATIALAAAVTAQPIDISARIKAAKPGAVIVAPPGKLLVSINSRVVSSPPVTIRGGTYERIELYNGGGIVFAGAVVQPSARPPRGAAVYLMNVSSVTFSRGSINGTDHSFNAVSLRGGKQVSFLGGAIGGVANGIKSNAVDGLTIRETSFSDLTGDGIGVTAARNVVIDRNTFTWPELDRIAHPDAIQVWDTKGTVTADIAITRNVVRTVSQGIFVKGEGHAGFDRVTIADNDIATDYVNALVLTNSRDSVVRNNRVRTLTGKKNVAKIGLHGNVRLTFTGNSACQMYETAPSTFVVKSANVVGKECKPVGLGVPTAAGR